MSDMEMVEAEMVEDAPAVEEAVEAPLASIEEIFLSVHRTLEEYEPLELPEDREHELTSLVFPV